LSFTGEFAQPVRFRDGKIANLRDFPSHAEAHEAAGLLKKRFGREAVSALHGKRQFRRVRLCARCHSELPE
jgi:hypothetical protein